MTTVVNSDTLPTHKLVLLGEVRVLDTLSRRQLVAIEDDFKVTFGLQRTCRSTSGKPVKTRLLQLHKARVEIEGATATIILGNRRQELPGAFALYE